MVFRADGTRRVANSLLTLFDQVDSASPGRNKVNDGTIGNDAHQATDSDHNATARNGDFGVITALDITHDPARGFDAGQLAETLRLNRDPRIKYCIFNGRIFSSTTSPWIWRDRNKGPGDHSEHVHISVGRGPDGHTTNPELYDDTTPWAIRALPGTVPKTGAKRFTVIATEFGGTSDPNNGAYDERFITDEEFGVALPDRIEGQRPKVRVMKGGKSVVCSIVDVGPWNSVPGDPYWETGAEPRVIEQFRTKTRADNGRVPTNLAAIDLTPAAARAIGLDGLGQVEWEFVTSEQPPMPDTSTTDALLRQLIEQVAALARVINAVKPDPVVDPPPKPVPQPIDPPPAPATETMQRLFGIVYTALASLVAMLAGSNGVSVPGVDPGTLVNTGLLGLAATALGLPAAAAPRIMRGISVIRRATQTQPGATP